MPPPFFGRAGTHQNLKHPAQKSEGEREGEGHTVDRERKEMKKWSQGTCELCRNWYIVFSHMLRAS